MDAAQNLAAVEVMLTQAGSPCPLITSIDSYTIRWPGLAAISGKTELAEALRAGMTPVISYWRSDDMLWMDGPGEDGRGPRAVDNAAACPASVKFYGISIETIGVSASPRW